MRRLKILHLGLILSTVALYFAGINAMHSRPFQFTVSTCNVLMQSRFVKTPLSNRERAFNKSFTEGALSKADIIVFQEFPSRGFQNNWSRQFRRDYWMHRPSGEVMVIARKSKFKFDTVKQYDIKKLLDRTYIRGAVALTLTPRGTNDRILVIGCHFRGGDGKKQGFSRGYEEFREVQLAQLMTFKDKIKNREKNNIRGVIIAGDLNWPYPEVASKEFLTLDGFKRGSDDVTAFDSGGKIATLDYIFFHGDLTLIDKEIDMRAKRSPHKGESADRSSFSDHSVVSATFRLADSSQRSFVEQVSTRVSRKSTPQYREVPYGEFSRMIERNPGNYYSLVPELLKGKQICWSNRQGIFITERGPDGLPKTKEKIMQPAPELTTKKEPVRQLLRPPRRSKPLRPPRRKQQVQVHQIKKGSWWKNVPHVNLRRRLEILKTMKQKPGTWVYWSPRSAPHVKYRSNTICGNKTQHVIQLLEHKLLILPGIDTSLFQASTDESTISSYPSKHLFAR